ncbi:torsin-4A [Electrophorus electricus]|uniref:AAA+ ATPase domain-containing protein n=1 Tax=Electrophorus electricus TaxID=8005 RepID=A0A4W4FEQ0_ELEEL|nr:torsin-4A [Electrophorus electricus]XP_026888067.2 torsin-4A [Electrophorus electricus]
MSDQDIPEKVSESEPEMRKENGTLSFSEFSSSVRAMVRIRQKYQAIKKRRLEISSAKVPFCTSARSTSPKVFTFDGVADGSSIVSGKKKKKKKARILFPSGNRRVVPTKEHSRAKSCLVLLCVIVFLQVYNAIENLDDHVLKYDLEGLEKTIKREVFGQQEASEGLLGHLRDYLSTYVHSKPLVLSLLGPSGVGKSHLGRLLAQHFRSVVGEQLVLQYYVLHHCPTQGDHPLCTQTLTTHVSEMVTLAEEEEKIPVFIFDEMEHMPIELLDTMLGLVTKRDSNEYLNAIYILISNLEQGEITKFILQNSSSITASARGRFSKQLSPLLLGHLKKHHALWLEAELLPLTLLEKSHVMECFIDEMSREGFYPDRSHVERLTEELSYYAVGDRQFSRTGCKQVVAKVNLL